MSKRIRVSDESLNVYGFWVKTSGIDMSDFKKNPIMLWNHNQGWRGTDDEVLPIGIWKDLSIDGAEITAIPEIDTEDSFASRISAKFEKGHLRAASIGIQILEWSDNPSMLKQGQTRPTVIKCKLREISLVDIPANKNAVVLYDQDGSLVNLSDAGALPELPVIYSNKIEPAMEQNQMVAAALGLPATATLADILSAISKQKDELQRVSNELNQLKDAQLKDRKAAAVKLLDQAVNEGRIPQNLRANYERLFETDFDAAKAVVDGLPSLKKLSQFTDGGEGSAQGTYEGKTFVQLSKEAPEKLQNLKENNPELFKSLYKAQYGTEYKPTNR